MATIQEALGLATQYHQSGQLQFAQQMYRRILAVAPGHAEALHGLGVIAHQVGEHELALEYIGRAIAVQGTAALHTNLGEVYRACQRIPEAITCYRRALELDPDFALAHSNLGKALKSQGKPDEAIACYRRALQLQPDAAQTHNDLGNVLKGQGQAEPAMAHYRRALELNPDLAEAHSNLGSVLTDLGQPEEAVACCRRALELRPDLVQAHNNLGNAFADQGKLQEAVACYRRALELRPDVAATHNNLGSVLKEQGDRDSAIACYRRALQLQPDFAEAHNNLGNALRQQGQLDEAVALYRRAVELRPDHAPTHSNLGQALTDQGQLDAAVACCRRALELQPGLVPAHCHLGDALVEQGKLDDAVACYRRALQLRPDFAEAHNGLGIVGKIQGDLDGAVAYYRRALELRPAFAEACSNLGSVLKDQGDLDGAIACYRRALELKPDFAEAQSNALYTLHFCPGYSAHAIGAEHRQWNDRHARRWAGVQVAHGNDRSAERRLRVGYLSPNFCAHPVGRFLLPLLETHNHQDFHIFCYSLVHVPDPVTDRCRALADDWRKVDGLSDEQLAGVIRLDQIDILVDLAMHMAGNRIRVFARKPAPIQVTYLAYCGTTGLHAMDYRLSDPYLDPPSQPTSCYCEQTVRLPETYWCYAPPPEAPAVNDLPALAAGHVTFGCLNNFCKVTAPTLAVWGRLLHAVRGSCLLLHAHPGSHRDRVRETLAQQGVAPDRVSFVNLLRAAEYLRTYQRIDLALDPFPYGGGTTTCDALWMGVPVVSLAGTTAVGRGGLSILSNLGLPQLSASDADAYVGIAAALAQDLPRLRDLRCTLRQRMQASPLLDAPRFARNVEAAYRTMWRRWCEADARDGAEAAPASPRDPW